IRLPWSRSWRSPMSPVGWVPDLLAYYALARVVVVPLRWGAGTKGKLIEALMAATPVVSTSVGSEGLDLVGGSHLLLADDAETFASEVSRLLTDDGLWARLARDGRDRTQSRHNRRAVVAQLGRALEAALGRTPKAAGPRSAPDPDVFHQRLRHQAFERVFDSLAHLVDVCLPEGASVTVASDGDEDLLDLGGRPATHFPAGPDGSWTGAYPASAAAATAELDRVGKAGCEYFVLPVAACWTMPYYGDLTATLAKTLSAVGSSDSVGTIYKLRGPAPLTVVQDHHGRASCSSAAPEARLVAFYLPQFHPIADNDLWWGEGFTEWANVAAATPLFPGHVQPRLPADLGFCDLRSPETRSAQAELAMRFGIEAFCYYHYWFEGRQLLERPFEEVLSSGEPPISFCLCWANEPWSRRWDGSQHSLLQAQTYSPSDDLEHIRWLLPALGDHRALRIGGRPVFIVYRARDLPEPMRTTDLWRNETSRAGLGEVYLIAVESPVDRGWDATTAGFDSKLRFQPDWWQAGLLPRSPAGIESLRVYDYASAWPVLATAEPVAYRRFETVFPRWDNTPRVGPAGVVFSGSTPEDYGRWLRHAVGSCRDQPGDQRLVFLNAWNEWAEGCHLEPDQHDGLAYLEATRDAVSATAARKLR
ncbi:MAG: glycoside hydrolase family 99-like domain-containing protein, partial [Acidimicrobiales bacterium]